MLLGVVNHLFKKLCDLWPVAKEWPASLHIPLQPFHGGHYNGNDCMKLLRGLDKLQKLSEKHRFATADGFIQALSDFKEVVVACFGNDLDPDFESKISNFKRIYTSLQVSITPKVHAVFYHVPQFIKIKKLSLGLFSEQATEALHSNFKPHWARYKRELSNPEYSNQLLKCVVDYNSKKV